MVREAIPLDVSDKPELARLAEEVAQTGQPRLLRQNGTDLAVLRPVKPARRKRKTLTPEERVEAVLSTAGAWVGLIDAEQFKREIREGRSDHRPPVEL